MPFEIYFFCTTLGRSQVQYFNSTHRRIESSLNCENNKMPRRQSKRLKRNEKLNYEKTFFPHNLAHQKLWIYIGVLGGVMGKIFWVIAVLKNVVSIPPPSPRLGWCKKNRFQMASNHSLVPCTWWLWTRKKFISSIFGPALAFFRNFELFRLFCI